MSALDLDALDALAAGATPGPWSWWTSNSFRRLSSDATGKDGDVLHASVHRDGHGDISGSDGDKAFIAAAREAVPALVAEVRRLRTREETLLDSVSALNSFDAPAELVAARARAEAAELERDRLRAHITKLAVCADNGHDEAVDGAPCSRCGAES